MIEVPAWSDRLSYCTHGHSNVNGTEDQISLHPTSSIERNADDHDEDNDDHDFKSIWHCLKGVWNLGLISILLGPEQQQGEWIGNGSHGYLFMARFGVLFEGYRGPAVIRVNASYNVDPVTRYVDRGKLLVVKKRPLFVVPSLRIPCVNWTVFESINVHRHHLQLSTTTLEFTKLIFLGCLVAGIGDETNSITQVSALLLISILLLFILR